MSDVRLSLVEVLTERLVRHSLTRPAADEPGYLALFRSLQPVSPQANSYPDRHHDSCIVLRRVSATRRWPMTFAAGANS
ncbi:MAG: hypothetical protein VCE12_18045 [Candidatus Latescibacterota bacterium]